MLSRAPHRSPTHGFTIVELVITMVLFGIMAATLTVFFAPAMRGFVDARTRSDLVEQADAAVRRMVRDIQLAVPNSIRTPNAFCFELVPTSMGGRARKGPDTALSAVMDTTTTTTSFDVLSPLPATPAIGDWVVVDNQNAGDVYGAAPNNNRSAITAVTGAQAGSTAPGGLFGKHRLTVNPKQFPLGYDGARFVVVPDNQKAVFYVCSGADGTLDANGNGKGALYRLANYGFNASAPGSCPSTIGQPLLANHVKSCRFIYDPNQGATQQNGFVSLQLEFARDSETTSLIVGAHVANTP